MIVGIVHRNFDRDRFKTFAACATRIRLAAYLRIAYAVDSNQAGEIKFLKL